MAFIDDIGWQLLRDLQHNARLPFAELGRRVGLSLPAVADRVRRMEESGIIEGYRAKVSAEKIGLPLTVFIQLKTVADHYTRFIQHVECMPEVMECHQITGVDSFIMKAAVCSKEHLAEIICSLNSFGDTTTSLVLSTPVSGRVLEYKAGLDGTGSNGTGSNGTGSNGAGSPKGLGSPNGSGHSNGAASSNGAGHSNGARAKSR